jgi:hypothetical protein
MTSATKVKQRQVRMSLMISMETARLSFEQSSMVASVQMPV